LTSILHGDNAIWKRIAILRKRDRGAVQSEAGGDPKGTPGKAVPSTECTPEGCHKCRIED
jgi:hypothetical protein